MKSQEERLDSFLEKLSEQFQPAIPKQVVEYHLKKTGFQTSDDRLYNLIALATQKFVSDVCGDAMLHCEQRQQSSLLADGNVTHGVKAGKKRVLKQEDLAVALQQWGIDVQKPQYFLSD